MCAMACPQVDADDEGWLADEQGDEGGAMSKFKVQEPPKSCKDYAAKHVAKSMFEYMQQHSKDFGIGKGDTRRLRGGLQF